MTTNDPDRTDLLAELQESAREATVQHRRGIAARALVYRLVLGSMEQRQAALHQFVVGFLRGSVRLPDDELAATVRGLVQGLDAEVNGSEVTTP